MQESSDLSESSDNTPALPSLGFSNNSHTLGLTTLPLLSAATHQASYQKRMRKRIFQKTFKEARILG
jgi:hypothetical protein